MSYLQEKARWNGLLGLFVSSKNYQVSFCYLIYFMQEKYWNVSSRDYFYYHYLNNLHSANRLFNCVFSSRNFTGIILSEWNEPRVRMDWIMNKIPFYIFPLIRGWSTLVQKACLEVNMNDYTWIKWSKTVIEFKILHRIHYSNILSHSH